MMYLDLVLIVCFQYSLRIFATEIPFSTSVTEDLSITLSNEECRPRPTLIGTGDEKYNYFPMIISLSQCGGTIGRDKPNFKKCTKDKYTNVHLHVFNDVYQQNETLLFENHTSCKAECVHDGSVCTTTQMWDPHTCHCICDKSIPEICPDNYRWNPNLCICECEISCNRRQVFNVTGCSCNCKDKFYQRCNRKNKFLRETDCKCYLPEALIGVNTCHTLPTKWAVIIIIISFCAIFVCSFDIILYTRKTGCVYHCSHLCQKEGTQDETTPIKHNRNSVVTVDSTV